MKPIFVVLAAGLFTGHVTASPAEKIVQSCLKTQSISGDVRYLDIAPSSFGVEDDDSRKIVSTTFAYRNRKVGFWEVPQSNKFGLIYASAQIPVRRIVKLGPQAPSAFNPYTAQWGEVQNAKEKYLCITFNFEGLGESGVFQNIRGLYLIDLKSRPAKFYYTVGDVRKIKN